MILPDISSASGIEMLNNNYYIIGDDIPWLFEMNSNYDIIRKIVLFNEDKITNGRIPKSIKPDYESIMSLPWGKDTDLFIFGSGSNDKRKSCLRIDFDDKKAKLINIISIICITKCRKKLTYQLSNLILKA